MLYTYRVDCWVNPKSGFELAKQNKYLARFKKVIRALFSENQPFQKALDSFGKNYEGMVLESLIIETDQLYEDSQVEIESEIKRKYPEAIIISHTILKASKDLVKS
jgi:hypothetical protein